MSGERLVRNLMKPGVYAHRTYDLRLVETHCAWVLLTGDIVYKIKKPVDFGFLDFSTLEKRCFYCQEEVRLNRRFAPDIYLDVIAITGSEAHPELGGEGDVIEYAVRMRQFAAGGLLSELAEKGALERQHVDQLVECIAGFHQQAPGAGAADEFGEPADIHHWVRENYQHILPLLGRDDDRQRVVCLSDWSDAEYQRLQTQLQRRKLKGAIRECHGDLHLGNITVIDGRVTPFDCIEFNPQLRWIDVISEVAFLLMDLDDRRQVRFAWRFLNGYLQRTGDYSGLGVLRYYLVYRAMVRAKVAILRRHQLDSSASAYSLATDEYLQYMQLAETYVADRPVSLLITHGVSGSGKSTIAAQLCERMGMLQLRSDVERKRLAGLAAAENSHSDTGGGLYTAGRTARTYQHLGELAGTVLKAGYSVVVDATFLKRSQRDRFFAIAEIFASGVLILDCRAETRELEQRITARAATQHDASEATIDVLHAQLQSRETLTEDEVLQAVSIDTACVDIDAIETEVKAVLDRAGSKP